MHRRTKDRMQRRSFQNHHVRVLTACFIMVGIENVRIPWTASHLFDDDMQ